MKKVGAKLRLNVINASVLVMLCTLFTSYSFGQIDSISVNLQFTTEVDELDSLSTVDVLNVEATIDDVAFVGDVTTMVYDSGTDYLVSMVKMSKQDYIDENLLIGNTLTTEMFGVDPAGSYRIETSVTNFQGANLPKVITNHN